MKNKILIFIFMLLSLILLVGCEKEEQIMYIECNDKIIIETSSELKVYYDNELLNNEDLLWTLSDYSVVQIVDGVIYGLNYGKVSIAVVDKNNPTHYCAKQIEVVAPYVTDIIIEGVNELRINKSTILKATVEPYLIESEVIWSSSNENVVVVSNGEVFAVGVGKADIIVVCDDFEKRFAFTVTPEPTNIEIYGETNISIQQVVTFTYNIDDEVMLESSNSEVVEIVDNVLYAKNLGTATITAYKVSDPNVSGTIEVTVDGRVSKIEMTDEEATKISEIINSLSVEQLVGQMFNVGINSYKYRENDYNIDPSTGLPYAQFTYFDTKRSISDFLSEYKFGNFTIKHSSALTTENLMLATKTLNKITMDNFGIEPLISMMDDGIEPLKCVTNLPYNISIGSINLSTTKTISSLYAQELKALGINSVFSNYLTYNPSNGSLEYTYGNDITKATLTSSVIKEAYASNGVIFVPDMSKDALIDNRGYEEVYSKDFKLLEAAIQNNYPIISVPIELYDNFKSEYAFMDESFINNYIREELGYEGVLTLDKSLMYWFGAEQLNEYITKAINMGIDMIGFDIIFSNWYWNDYSAETQNWLNLYTHIINSVNDGTISIDRIKESVSRILLMKLRNNILEQEKIDYSDYNFNQVENELYKHTASFIVAKGDLYDIQKHEKILIMSEPYSVTGTTNSLASSLYGYLSKAGYNLNAYYYDSMDPNAVIKSASNYDKVIIGLSEMYDSKQIGMYNSRMKYTDFIEQLREQNPNICFIITDKPTDLNYFPWATDYILLNGVYEDNFDSICMLFNKEITLK